MITNPQVEATWCIKFKKNASIVLTLSAGPAIYPGRADYVVGFYLRGATTEARTVIDSKGEAWSYVGAYYAHRN